MGSKQYVTFLVNNLLLPVSQATVYSLVKIGFPLHGYVLDANLTPKIYKLDRKFTLPLSVCDKVYTGDVVQHVSPKGARCTVLLYGKISKLSYLHNSIPLFQLLWKTLRRITGGEQVSEEVP